MIPSQSSLRERVEALPTAVSEGLHPLALSKALFFTAAGLSFLLSVYLWFSGDRERGVFVGLWVPSILSAGALLLGGGARRE
jgi:hypothetical protein